MKKIIPLLLALMLLCACGATVPADSPPEADMPEPQTSAEKPQAEPETTAEDSQAEESEEEIMDQDSVKPAEAVTVTLDGVSSYLRLTLPEGWTFKAGEETKERHSLVLLPPTDDGFQLEMVRWDFFGMCGTGVTFSDVELSGGLKATLATERNSDYVWWTLILPPSPDQFTLQFGAELDLFEAHQAELEEILSGLTIGVLAEQHSVLQPRADS